MDYTRTVKCWIEGSNESAHNFWVERAKYHLKNSKYPKTAFAREFKNSLQETAYQNFETGLYLDLIQRALHDVDYDDIAEGYMELAEDS